MTDASEIPVDLARLGEWMDGQGLEPGPIEGAEMLAGGTQNILLRFSRGGTRFVLRRPPCTCARTATRRCGARRACWERSRIRTFRTRA